MYKVLKFGKFLFFRGTLLIFLFAGIAGCRAKAGDDEVLAIVGNKKITVSDFTRRVKNLPESYQRMADKRRKQFLEDIINDQLLYEEAMRKGLERDKETRELLNEARKKILVARFLEEHINDEVSVSEEDITSFYEENADKYRTPEVMRVSHILVPGLEEADNIVKELDQGKRFEDLARARSLDPTAQRGGDIGYFPKGRLMPEFDEACSNLQIGEISAPVKTKLGYHVIMLTDRRAPQPVPVEKVREDIERRVTAVKRKEIFDKTLEDLRSKKKININEEALEALETISPDDDDSEVTTGENKGGDQ